MDQAQQNVHTLSIQLLGGFSVKRGQHTLTDASRRSRRLWVLMQYLLIQQGRRVPVGELIQTLWGDEECQYPERALQNLVYRLRLLLAQGETSQEKTDYILQSQGSYYWNAQAPCVIDTQQFEKTIEMARQADRDDQYAAEALYRAAMSYYGGELLPDCGYDEWIIAPRSHFKMLYLSTVQRLIVLLKQHQMLESLVEVCSHAERLEPYEESVRAAKIEAYLDMGKIALAKAEYENVSQLLYRDLGVRPSAALAGAYRRLRSGVGNAPMDMDAIQHTITGTDVEKGAFFCTPEAFSAICRVEARRLPRSNISLYLVLLTLLDSDFGELPTDVRQHTMELLIDCAQHSLRRSDVITRWSDTQLAILLHSLSYENGKMVLARIKDSFSRQYSGKKIVLRSSLRAMDIQAPREFDSFGREKK